VQKIAYVNVLLAKRIELRTPKSSHLVTFLRNSGILIFKC